MKLRIRNVVPCGLLVLGLLAGCAPQNIQILQQENQDLKARLRTAKTRNQELQHQVEECRALSETLAKEKKAKEEDITSLREITRAFLKSQFDALTAFSRHDELMDYVGGELIERARKDGKNLTVVNLAPLGRNCVVYCVKGLFDPGTKVKLKLFRPTDQGLLCIWESPVLVAAASGVQKLDLDTPLNALKGDVIGFYFPDKPGTPYDLATGSFRVFTGEIKLGKPLPAAGQADHRNYSIGISGLLD